MRRRADAAFRCVIVLVLRLPQWHGRVDRAHPCRPVGRCPCFGRSFWNRLWQPSTGLRLMSARLCPRRLLLLLRRHPARRYAVRSAGDRGWVGVSPDCFPVIGSHSWHLLSSGAPGPQPIVGVAPDPARRSHAGSSADRARSWVPWFVSLIPPVLWCLLSAAERSGRMTEPEWLVMSRPWLLTVVARACPRSWRTHSSCTGHTRSVMTEHLRRRHDHFVG